ncbi:MAG TPA: hypothetical protein VGC32_11130, partial [Solirubrobacterales bacterium]
LGDLATLPLQHGADAVLAAVGAALALAALAAGLLGIGGLRLEAARRRAELVAEMRFSASVQDLRTVILLRRQLASEHPRRKPWIRLRVTVGNPIWRRDWQSYLRWPLVRIVRVLLIAVAAGGLAVAGFDLTPVLFALPGPLLFIAALDLIEPLAQESDHPTRRLLLPFAASELIRRHLWAPIAAMAFALLIATATAAVASGNPGLAIGVGLVVFIPLAAVMICAAAVSATNDPYEFALAPQIAQTVSLGPIVVSLIAGFLPLFAAWKIEGGNGARVSGAFGIDIPLVLFAMVGLGVLAWRFNKREKQAL